MNVKVVGLGPASDLMFTEEVKLALSEADKVFSSSKRMDYVKKYAKNTEFKSVTDTLEYINANGEKDEKIIVAASGDVGFYSIASTLRKYVTNGVKIEYMCGISSMSYFMSKIGMGYEDVELISLHGKEKSIVPYVSYNEKVFALTGGKIKADDIVSKLIESGFEDGVTVYVGENLSFSNERIIKGSPKDLENMEFSDLAVVLIHNENYVNKYRTLKDGDFIRGKSPMTKEAIRNLSLSALSIEPEDVVYDVGAGTGSVSCAMAYKAFRSTVYAIEKKEAAFELVKENIKNTGARNIHLVCGEAPFGMESFPAPDKVFIGGSTGRAREIIDLCVKKNPRVVFVVNAIALETVSSTVNMFKEMDFEMEIQSVNVSNAEKIGSYHLMKAENPIYIIKAWKRKEIDE